MVYRTWVRLLGATLGVAALAGACQLGVAYGLGILRLTRVLDVTTRDQWTAQLAWVAWFAMMAAVAGGFAGGWLLPRWSPTRPTTGTAVAVAVAAGVGAAIVVPLTMQPARTAQIAGVHPVFVIGVCAGLGALAGVLAVVAALLQPVSRWGLVVLGGVVWLIAIVSVLPSLAPDDPLPSVRLGVFDAGFLSPGTTQRTALFTMPAVALIAGALLGWRARRRELPTLTIALAGLPGPALLTAAYLIAGPGSGSDRYQVVPYWAAMTATGAGVLGSVLAAVINRPGVTSDEPEFTERVDSDTGASSGTAAAGDFEPDPSPVAVSAEPSSAAASVPWLGGITPRIDPRIPEPRSGIADEQFEPSTPVVAPSSFTSTSTSASTSTSTSTSAEPAEPSGSSAAAEPWASSSAAEPSTSASAGEPSTPSTAAEPSFSAAAEPSTPSAAAEPSTPSAAAEAKRPRRWGRRRSGPDTESPATTTGAERAPDDPTNGLSPTRRPDTRTEMRPDMHRETRPESWLDTPLETPLDTPAGRRPETLGDTPPGPARSEWTTHHLAGTAAARPGGRVVLGNDADDPEPFDAFRRPGTDDRGLGYGYGNRPAQHAADDSGPYVPEPALRPLPPGVAQEERSAGGRLGRSLNPFSRGRTDPASTGDFPPTPAAAPIPAAGAPPTWATAPAPASVDPPAWATYPALADPPTPVAGPDTTRRARHGAEPATDDNSDPYGSADEAASASPDDATKRRGWRRTRSDPADEPAPAPALADPAPTAFDAPPDTSEPASESKRAARKRKKDEEFVDWVSGLGGE